MVVLVAPALMVTGLAVIAKSVTGVALLQKTQHRDVQLLNILPLYAIARTWLLKQESNSTEPVRSGMIRVSEWGW